MSKIVKIDVPNSKAAADRLAKRDLNQTFPQLKTYLKPGFKVLDVGCGPGSITVGVAETVLPGEVVGLDPIKEWIEQGAELAGAKGLRNIEFIHGDTHFLDFSDNYFDVTYSHEAMQYILDPVLALKEQKRVTRPGGRVIAKYGMGGDSFRHPNCPALEKLYNARTRYTGHLRAKYKPGDHIRGFFNDPYAGRKCVEWFQKAGLDNLKIEILPNTVDAVECPGNDSFGPDTWLRRLSLDGSRSETWKGMIDAGYLDVSLIKQAQEEIEAWYKEPHTFAFALAILAVALV